MVAKKKFVGLVGGGRGGESSDSKLNPTKSVGKSLLDRVRKFREKGGRG